MSDFVELTQELINDPDKYVQSYNVKNNQFLQHVRGQTKEQIAAAILFPPIQGANSH
jgi:hypothetical protein